ncbi:MAG: hypothetical protein HY909_04440 [Deltaproteobacteria bacterium]|nr:hypothetical protein [Deltaproteobacteria bacterium]
MDDAGLYEAFLARAIPKDDWTHRAHVRVAWCALRAHGTTEAALPVLRGAIRRLNEAQGGQNTATAGYHETITVAMLRLVEATLRAHGPAAGSEAFCDAHPHLLRSSVLWLYYTRGRLLSERARARYVAPDVGPLPYRKR